LSLPKPVTIMLVGGIDSGKTSFCTFLVNEAVKENCRTGVIDADLGQSDVGPPSTVGFTSLAEPVKDLFELDAKDAVFVGSTSPSRAINSVIEALALLKEKAVASGIEFLVVNTDGWVEGEEATAYKVKLAETVGAGAVVGLQRENELAPLLEALLGVKTSVLETPQLIQPRSRERRRILRELSYKKYLKGAKVQSISLRWVKVVGSLFGVGVPLTRNWMDMLTKLFSTKPVYAEETASAIIAVLARGKAVDEENVRAAEEHFGKDVKLIREGDEEGLLVGLSDEEGRLLGIGIITAVDYPRRILKVYTPVTEKVSAICFGQIKLDKNCRETGLSTVYSSSPL